MNEFGGVLQVRDLFKEHGQGRIWFARSMESTWRYQRTDAGGDGAERLREVHTAAPAGWP